MAKEEKKMSKLVSEIPDSSENMRKARILKKFLVEDEKGHIQIKEMEEGMFEKFIPDETLAAVARNLFVKWKEENNITKSYDLGNLYLLVMNYIKTLMANELVMKYFSEGKLKAKEGRKLLKLSNKLDGNYQRLAAALGSDLAMDRKSRMKKKVKATNELGESITMVLSKKLEDE